MPLLRSTTLALPLVLIWTQQFADGDFTRAAPNVTPASGPWRCLAYSGGICVAFFVAGVRTANRRDA
ncbi:hypothetical protein AB0F91_39435 [Amycolatopsis sp. NPDC023774]|uniref:hypothetical protein n=1 Tax=Amycolatopsis sp. NPDC023774 TaxID=3155015 RepID=UPI0033FEAA7B